MRIRKYRVWDRKAKQLIYPDALAFISKDFDGHIDDCMVVPYDDDDVTEFIGLQDKDGRDIFEGDILKVDADNENPGVIKWSNNGCYLLIKKLMNSKETASKQVNKGSTKFWTVIGNIFENPEFLD